MRIRLALAALGILIAPAAEASPQILALLSTYGSVPLNCENGVCTAELTSFCLEQKRAVPESGTAYRAVPNSGVVLIVTASDGTVRELDGAGLAAFSALRDMTAVRVTIDQRRLGDAAAVAIRTNESSVLLPLGSTRQGAAHTSTEIDTATGPLRSAAARIVDRDPRSAVARGISLALNRLHRDGDAAALIADAVSPVVRACAGKVAEEKARRQELIGVYGYWTGRSIVGELSLGTCLEEAHGTLMTTLNRRFWHGGAAVEPAVKPDLRM